MNADKGLACPMPVVKTKKALVKFLKFKRLTRVQKMT
jgi:TusA-related sulfurtransferase